MLSVQHAECEPEENITCRRLSLTIPGHHLIRLSGLSAGRQISEISDALLFGCATSEKITFDP